MGEPKFASGGRLVVGIAAFSVARPPIECLVTHALGSCIGITAFDPIAKVAGLLHFMLPAPSPGSIVDNVARFGMTGIPELFRTMYNAGASKQNILVCAAGGSQMLATQNGDARIGERNHTILRKLLWKNGIALAAEDIGGTASRTLTLDMLTGDVFVEMSGQRKRIYPQA